MTATASPVEEEELELEEEGSPASGKPRLTPAQWAEIRAVWRRGAMTVEDLSKSYGVSRSALFKHFKKNGVTWRSEVGEVEEEAAKAIIDESAEALRIRKERIEDTKEKHYTYQKALDELIMATVLKQVRSGGAVGNVFNDIKTLRAAKAALALGRQERYAILNAEQQVDEEQLTKLVIEDRTDDEIREEVAAADTDEIDLDELAGEIERLAKAKKSG